jgi:hypothetical protein
VEVWDGLGEKVYSRATQPVERVLHCRWTFPPFPGSRSRLVVRPSAKKREELAAQKEIQEGSPSPQLRLKLTVFDVVSPLLTVELGGAEVDLAGFLQQLKLDPSKPLQDRLNERQQVSGPLAAAKTEQDPPLPTPVAKLEQKQEQAQEVGSFVLMFSLWIPPSSSSPNFLNEMLAVRLLEEDRQTIYRTGNLPILPIDIVNHEYFHPPDKYKESAAPEAEAEKEASEYLLKQQVYDIDGNGWGPVTFKLAPTSEGFTVHNETTSVLYVAVYFVISQLVGSCYNMLFGKSPPSWQSQTQGRF